MKRGRPACPGSAGAPIWPSAPGAPCARTIATPATPVPGIRVLERPRSNPERTALWAHRERGKPRRRRQRILVVSGLDAHALLDAVAICLPARGVSIRSVAGRKSPPRPGGPGVRTAGHRYFQGEPVLGYYGRLREGVDGRHLD